MLSVVNLGDGRDSLRGPMRLKEVPTAMSQDSQASQEVEDSQNSSPPNSYCHLIVVGGCIGGFSHRLTADVALLLT